MKMTKKASKTRVSMPKLKVLDPAEFRLVNGGSGDGSARFVNSTLRHAAGASADI